MPHTATRLRDHMLPLAAALVAACAKTSDTATPASTQSAATAVGGQMAGAGTQDAQAMATDSAIQRVQAHIQEMTGTTADSEAVMLPEHRALVSNMLTQMSNEMSARHVPADARWTALADSVRQRLTQLTGMRKSELGTVMPAHRQRLQRLIEVYRAMMGGGGQTRG